MHRPKRQPVVDIITDQGSFALEAERRAIKTYSSLDPSQWAPTALLKEIVEVVGVNPEPYRQLIAGACALEWSTHPDLYKRQRKPIARQANQHLLATSSSARHDPRADRLLATAKLMQQGLHPSTRAAYARSSMDHFAQALDRLRQSTSPEQRSDRRGLVHEDVVIAVIESLGHSGLVAYTSLPRQDETTVKVDGRKFSWDLTVESDGKVIPEGRYFSQCKSLVTGADLAIYHHDIVLTSSTRPLADVPGKVLDQTYEAIFCELTESSSSERSTELSRAQDLILTALTMHGPSREDLVLLR